MKHKFVIWGFLVLISLNYSCKLKDGSSSDKTAQASKRPNIILILADDFGYMDIQEYARKITGEDKDKMFYETPNLDRLVNEGVAFSRAYACQLCSPTRASILTGKNAARLGFTTATPFSKTYYNQGMLAPEGSYAHDVIYHSDEIEIEQALINGSTNTAIPAGTVYDHGRDEVTIAEALPGYHSAFIGKWHVGGHGAKGYSPADQGFEPIAWFDAGGSAYFDWRTAWNNRSKKLVPNIPQDELYMGNAGEQTGENYLTDDLTEQALRYIDKRADIDQPFFLYFCHFAVHSPWQGQKEVMEYFDIKDTKGWNGHKDSRYAAMIKSMDTSVGKIINKLETTGLDENTLVIFMSDNGGIDNDVEPNGFITDNSPLTGGKACLSEGGIRVPLIFWWKGKIAGGKWSDVAVDCTDILPTIVEAANYNTDRFYNEIGIDGRSILPLLDDTKNTRKGYQHDTRYWHYPFNVVYKNPFDGLPLTPHSAIMERDFKLIFDWYGRLQLFNVKDDISESNNLVSQMPEKTNELFDKLMKWLDVNVKETYWPQMNSCYNSQSESHNVPFVNLVNIYRSGGNVAKEAN